MTFKHTKFDDSAVLRSLEKIAVQKGLAKPEAITKSASQLVNERDLSATGDLSNDIMKLCAGLRRDGLHKHADDIEFNFVNYKKAQTLYETSKETGEDVVHAAHPDGPAELDVDGKHKVLDIISRQLQMIKTVNKEPTGKLAYRNNLKALKMVLAHEAESAQELIQEAKEKVLQAKTIYNQLCEYTDGLLYINISRADSLSFDQASSTPSTLNLMKLQSEIKAVEKNAAPATSWYQLGHGVPKEKWAPAKQMFDDIYDLIGDEDKNKNLNTYNETAYALSYKAEHLSKLKKPSRRRPTGPVGPTDLDPGGVSPPQKASVESEFKIVDAQISRMRSFKRTENVRNNPRAVNVADKIIAKFEEIKKFYSDVEDPEAIIDELKEEVQTGVNTVNKFKEKYVKSSKPTSTPASTQ